MVVFTLQLHSATQAQRFDAVTTFVGVDESGSFAIRAGHERMMTVLDTGLARFRQTDSWRYLALPAAVLYFYQNHLTLSTRHYLVDDDLDHIARALSEQLLAEEESLRQIKGSLRRMEDELLKRLYQLDSTALRESRR